MKLLARNTFGARTLVAAALVCTALLGCGGDDDSSADGGGGEIEPLVITVDNMGDVAGAVIATNSVSGSLYLLGTDINVEDDVAVAAQTSSLPSSSTHLLAKLAVKTLESVKDKLASANVLSGAEFTNDFGCLTGTGTYTWDDRDVDDTLSAGDVVTFNFDKCQLDDPVGMTLTGTLRVTVTELSNDTAGGFTAGQILESINLTLDHPDFNLTANGTFEIDEALIGNKTPEVLDFLIKSSSLSYVVLVDNQRYEVRQTNYVFDGTEYLYHGTAEAEDYIEWVTTQSMGVIFPTVNGSFDVTTLNPVFEYYNGGITAGELEVTGADNTVLRITFLPGYKVRLKLDSDGDGTFEVEQDKSIYELTPIYGIY